jgi:uncharacterized protein (DUF885 family)
MIGRDRSFAHARWALLAGLVAACGGLEPEVNAPPAVPPPEEVPAAEAPPAWPKDGYRQAIGEGLETLLSNEPVLASSRGDHRFDGKWPDVSEEGARRTAELYRAKVAELRAFAPALPATLTGAEVDEVGTDHPALDASLLADRLEATAFELTELARMDRDPSALVELIGDGVTSLTTHEYAPMHVRYAALATRLAAVPDLVRVARGRLKKATRAGFENVLITEPGLSRALRMEVAKVDVRSLDNDQSLADGVRAAATAAATALDAYVEDLEKSFPTTTLDRTPIGAAAWATLARLSEGVGESPAEVRRMGEAELERLTRQLDELIDASPRNPRQGAARSLPHGPKDRAEFLHVVASSSLPEDKILAQYRYVNQGVEAWLKTHRFVTVPWDRAKVVIVQTPPQGRGTSFASMNQAGPLEPTASDARFEVNIPDPAMSPTQRGALRGFHSLGAIDLVSIHEALPGHYLQGLHLKELRSTVRRVIWSSTFGEGWAHYCEQAVLDAGYTGDEAERTRAFSLRMALQRAVRVIVDVAENDGSMSLEDGAKLLEERALLSPEGARIEARRALVRPVNMFSYTYGKLSILRLRQAIQSKEGPAFDLVRFHDRLLSVGTIPVGYVARFAFGLD